MNHRALRRAETESPRDTFEQNPGEGHGAGQGDNIEDPASERDRHRGEQGGDMGGPVLGLLQIRRRVPEDGLPRGPEGDIRPDRGWQMGRDLQEDIRIEQETDLSGSSYRCMRVHPRDLPINILGDRPMTPVHRYATPHHRKNRLTPSPDRRRVAA